jgi:Leucine-rich repeat (LRR) protein
LTHLTKLDLVVNPISDLSPLAGLKALTSLSLTLNQASDPGPYLSPLLKINSLEQLSIHRAKPEA